MSVSREALISLGYIMIRSHVTESRETNLYGGVSHPSLLYLIGLNSKD